MPIQVVKDPATGEERRVYVAPQGMGEQQAKPAAKQQGGGPSFGLQDLLGMTPGGMLMNSLQSSAGSIGAALQELQRTGDLGKAYQAGQRQYMKELEAPGRGAQRVLGMAGRNVMQEVSDVATADLPAALGVRGAKPTTAKQPDAPFLGVLPALPRAKSSGPIEDLTTSIVQAGIEWIPAARAVGLAGKGLMMLPGAARVAQGAAAVKGAVAASKVAQAAAKVPGAAVVGKAIASNALTKGAATGALIDTVGFDQHGGRLTDLLDKATKGTPLEGIAIDYLKSDPGDVGMEGRLKNALEGALLGTTLETAFRTLRVARDFNWWRRAPEAEKPLAASQLKQSTQELETEVAKQAYTVPDEAAQVAAPNLPGAARATNPDLQAPTASQVGEMDINAIAVDPKRFQFKAEGRKAETGVATPIEDPQGYSPLKGGVVSVWTDPADGVTYVVNGHSRLAEAKASGYDRVLVRQIAAPTADEARRIGALQNIQEGTALPKDATAAVKRAGMTAQDLAAEGLPLDNPAIAKQVPTLKAGTELTHGTSRQAAKAILEGGFKPSRAASGGALLGDGVYFTDSPRYASAYGDTAVVGKLPPDAKVLDLYAAKRSIADFGEEIGVGRPADQFEGDVFFSPQQQNQIRKWALDNGYDGIRFDPSTNPADPGAPEVVMYNLDVANQIAGSKAAPAPAPAAGPTAQEIQELDATLSRSMANLTPQQRVAVRNQMLQQKYEPQVPEQAAMPEPIAAPAPTGPLLRPGAELYHGTTAEGRKGIMDNGFRVSEAEKAGTVLGEGVYFASNERYAAAYGGKTAWGQLPADAKILDLQAQGKTVGELADEIGVTGPRETYGGDVRLSYEQQQQVKDWALANGYDGIRYRSFDTPDKPELETVIYNVDLANRIVGSKAAPAVVETPSTPAQPAAAGSGGEPPTPPPTVVEPPPIDDGWAQRLVQQVDQQRQALEDGTITMDDLLENNVQKIQSPSGQTAYVPGAPTGLVQALRAFSDTFNRADATGIPTVSFERVDKDFYDWLAKNNYSSDAVREGLKQLSGPLGKYEENLRILRAGQLLVDHTNLQAGIAANKWLNAAADETADMGQLTAELLTAAAQQKASNIALESVTRPIGQLLYSLQNPRPMPGTVPFDSQPVRDMGEELSKALQTEASVPVSESIGKALSPEAETAILSGDYTPQVLAEMDQLARSMAQSAVTPGFAKGFWKQVNDSLALGARGLVIYRASQLLSSGLTLWSNTINNTIRLIQMPLSQVAGAAMQGEFSRASQALQLYGQYVSNLSNAFRLGKESFKAGRGLYDLDETSVDFLDKLAKEDLQQTLLPSMVDRKAEWDLNTMPWLDVQDKSVWAIAQKRIWQALNLSTRTQVSLDTFFKVLAGQSFEYVRNLQPGLDRAIQQGLAPGSKEAWSFARDYAQAAVDRATRDVAIDGRTILDAVMTSPQAQTAMRYATFTDDIWAQMEPKTMQRGMELAQAQGLEGDAAQEFARKYLETAAEVPFFSRTFSMMPAAWQKLIDFSPLFSIIQPFNRTPGDLVKSAARMGGVTAPLVDTWWRDINSPDAFTRDRAIGDIAVGMGAISLGTIAMTQGRLEFTGGGPQNPEAKRKWRDEGKQPYSFRVRTGTNPDGTPILSDWVSMRAFEPIATLLGAIADYQEIANKLPKEARERLGSALTMDLMLAVSTGQLSKTYYQGFSELYEAAMGVGELDSGPNKRNPIERYISRLLVSMVPASSALRAGRRVEDRTVREIPPSDVEGGVLGIPMRLFEETMSEIKNMIPGWSESLPPRRNWITGEPIVLSGIMGDEYLPPDQPWLSFLYQYVPWSPFQKTVPQDPVLLEMARLSGKGATFRGPKNTDWGKELRLSPAEFDDYVQTVANVRDQFGRTIHQALTDMVNSDYYKGLPQEEVSTTVMSQRAAAIDLEVQRFRKLGKEAYEAKRPDLMRNLNNIEGLNKDVQYRLKYGQPIDVPTFVEGLR